MKNMFIYALIGSFCLFCHSSQAQLSVGVGYSAYFPTSWRNPQLGPTISGKYDITKKFRVGLNFGYFYKKYATELIIGMKTKITPILMPITASVEFGTTTKKLSPYYGIDAGLYRIGAKISVNDVKTSIYKSHFGFAPVLGLNYNLSEKVLLNTSGKLYTRINGGGFSTGFGIAAGLVYRFKQ